MAATSHYHRLSARIYHHNIIITTTTWSRPNQNAPSSRWHISFLSYPTAAAFMVRIRSRTSSSAAAARMKLPWLPPIITPRWWAKCSQSFLNYLEGKYYKTSLVLLYLYSTCRLVFTLLTPIAHIALSYNTHDDDDNNFLIHSILGGTDCPSNKSPRPYPN